MHKYISETRYKKIEMFAAVPSTTSHSISLLSINSLVPHQQISKADFS